MFALIGTQRPRCYRSQDCDVIAGLPSRADAGSRGLVAVSTRQGIWLCRHAAHWFGPATWEVCSGGAEGNTSLSNHDRWLCLTRERRPNSRLTAPGDTLPEWGMSEPTWPTQCKQMPSAPSLIENAGSWSHSTPNSCGWAIRGVRFSESQPTYGISTGWSTPWSVASQNVKSAAELSQFGLRVSLHEQWNEIPDAAAVESGVPFLNQAGYGLR